MGARHRGGVRLSYRPARLHRLAEFIPWNQFRGPIHVKKYGLRITPILIFDVNICTQNRETLYNECLYASIRLTLVRLVLFFDKFPPRREYYGGPGLIYVVWFGSSQTPVWNKLDPRHTGRLSKRDNLLTVEWGGGCWGGAKSHDSEKSLVIYCTVAIEQLSQQVTCYRWQCKILLPSNKNNFFIIYTKQNVIAESIRLFAVSLVVTQTEKYTYAYFASCIHYKHG